MRISTRQTNVLSNHGWPRKLRWGLVALSLIFIAACGGGGGDSGKTTGQTQITISIAPASDLGEVQVASADVSSGAANWLLNSLIRKAYAASLAENFPFLGNVTLQITGAGFTTAAINADFNDNKFAMAEGGDAILLVDTDFTLNVPDNVNLTFLVTAFNLDGFRIFRGSNTLTISDLSQAKVDLLIRLVVDIDERIPRLAADTSCADDDGDGICNLFEDVFVLASGIPDIDGDGLINSQDQNSDGDQLSDSEEGIFSSNDGFPVFIHANRKPTSAVADIAVGGTSSGAGVTPEVTDPDVGDNHTFSIVNQPSNGTASVINNRFVYVPVAGFTGNDSFTFLATDVGGLSVGGTANVTVLGTATDVEVAKALVSEIRTWINELELVGDSGESFAKKVELAAEAIKQLDDPGGSNTSGSTLGDSLTAAIDIAIGTYNPQDGDGTFPYSGFNFGFSGAGTLTVTSGEGLTILSLEGSVISDEVDLMLTFPTPGNQTVFETISASFSGTISNPDVILTLSGGSFEAVFDPPLDGSFVPVDPEVLDAEHTSSQEIVVQLATIQQLSVQNPVSFVGSLELDAVRVTTAQQFESDYNFTELVFDGVVADNTNEVSGNLVATLNNPLTFDSSLPIEGDNLPDISLELTLTAALQNLPEAEVTLGADISAIDANTGDFVGTLVLTVSHAGVVTTVEFEQTSLIDEIGGLATFTGQGGAQLVLSGNENDVQGTLTVNGIVFGSAETLNNGLVKVTYTDGTFETIQ